jgi:tetratricopeptide (TPR) repeat protein
VPDDVPTSPTLLSESSAAIAIESAHSLPDVTHALTSNSVSGVSAPFSRPPSMPPTTQRQGSGTYPPPPPPHFPAQAPPHFPAPSPVLVTNDRPPSGGFAGPTPLSGAYASEPPRSAAPIAIKPKARATGWVVAASLLVAVGSGAFLLGRRYTKVAVPVGAESSAFDFAAAFADVRAGRIEKARDAADAMSRVMGADERLLALRAEVAVASADVAASMAMVSQKIAAPDAAALALAAEEAASQAMKAAERAAETNPESPETLERLAVACSLSGARARARQFVERLGADESSHVYVRALVAAVEGREDRLARLERAFATEPFRARMRALAEQVGAGDPAVQTALVASLRSSTESASVLRWLDSLPAAPAVDAGVAEPKALKGAPSEDFGAPFEGAEASEGASRPGKAARKLTGDPRKALEEGERARRRGDLDQAKALFQVALDANPLDSEALAGLGDCARDARDAPQAIAYYRKALSANPSYLPARIGVADAQWASGDRDAASKAYREIMENFPEGAYPASVKERALGRPAGEEP